MNETVKRCTNKNRTFAFAPDKRFLKVYTNGRLSGFIFNTDKEVQIDGEKVKSSDFFK